MTPRSKVIRAVHVALLGAVLLAGCPSASDVGTGTPVAGLAQGGFVQPRTGLSECRTPENAEQIAADVLALVNDERTSRGLNPLTVDPVLTQIAEDYACKMITEEFFAHVDREGNGPGERAIQADYIFLAIGENLAGGQTSATQVMQEWMASTQGHRENILAAQWTEIGIAVRTGGEHGVYWVQEFGNPP